MEENEQDSRNSPSVDFTSSVGHIRLKTSFCSNTSERSASLKSDTDIASKLQPTQSDPPCITPVKRRWKDHHKIRRRSRGSPGFCNQNQVGKKDDEPFLNCDASAIITENPTNMTGKGTDGEPSLFPLSQGPGLIKSRSKFLLAYDSEEEYEGDHNTGDFMRRFSTSPYSPYPRSKVTKTYSDGDLHLNTMRTRRPIAASLEEYMEEGGTMKYFPRPEWCRTPNTSHLQKFCHDEVLYGRSQSDGARRDMFADGANDTTTIGNIPLDLNVPNPRPGDQCAPENGLLTDQSWGGPINGQNTSYIQPFLQYTSRHRNSTTSIAFVEQTANHLHHSGLIEVSSTSNDEESDNISFSQRLQMMSSSEDDASVLSQHRSHHYPPREENTLHQTALEKLSTACTFGKECNTALHACIQKSATKAAAELIRFGAPVNFSNSKGLTPIILASQKGNLDIVRILLKSGASPVAATFTGSTALIQASHYGHSSVVEFLLRHGAMAEQANYKNTTALMRAAQEGHAENVKLLLRYNCRVNRENHEKMTALMLTAQRGHAAIAKILIRAGATIDVKTTQDSTALMLACKRGHIEIAKVLIAAGSELMLRDSRGRTARDTAIRKGLLSLLDFITPQVQISLMKHDVIVERRHFMLSMWELLQQERATVKVFAISSEIGNYRASTTIHELAANLHGPLLKCMSTSRKALVLSMMLPMPLVGVISSYLPAPRLWEKRLEMLTRRSHIDADCTVSCALDLIDEVLDEGGFLEACDLSGIIPPANFETWAELKAKSKCGNATVDKMLPQNAKTNSLNQKIVNSNHELKDFIDHECTVVGLRRDACFLQLLAHRSPLLARTLCSPPYEIPSDTIQKLKNNSDIQSLVRRLGSHAGVHFEVPVANDVVFVANQLLLWYHSSDQSRWNE